MKTKKMLTTFRSRGVFHYPPRAFSFLVITLAVIGFIMQTKPIDAAASLEAHETYRSEFAAFVMAPGSTKDVTLTFKNIGTSTWNKEGASRVAINTNYPWPRVSAFAHDSWSTWFRPSKLPVDSVAPGESATFTLTLHAPNAPGEYIERFALSALPDGPILGGDFAFLITVGSAAPEIPLFRGRVTAISDDIHTFAPGEAKTVWIEFENTGRGIWTNPARSTIALETARPRLRESDFTFRWKTPGHPNYQREPSINRRERVKIFFALQAPTTPGTYVESFQLVAKGLVPVEWTQHNIRIQVTGETQATDTDSPSVMNEPTMRVGITTLPEGVTVDPHTAHTFSTIDGEKLAGGNAHQQSHISYNNGVYTLDTSGKKITTAKPIRVIPSDAGVTSIVNYRTYYDTFRGIIEIRYTPITGRLWVINELPFDQYMAGLAEAVNGQHAEYMKTLAIAARSYALWHYYVSTRHANEFFTINATTDQLYKGYYYEQKTSDFVEAVNATRGIVMTHPSAGFERNPLNIALGAYSSGTDGRTRNFTDVFGGKPEDWEWMVSVDDPLGIIPDAKTRPGNHMVGMSATGALRYAVRENKSYEWILKHYYTGIELEKLW